jgi:hypothetical protein
MTSGYTRLKRLRERLEWMLDLDEDRTAIARLRKRIDKLEAQLEDSEDARREHVREVLSDVR